MIRKLLATTAIVTLVSSGAYAQATTEPAQTPPPAATDEAPAATDAAPAAGGEVKEAEVVADGNLASNLVGETVYNGTGDDAENIGKVNDLVIDGEGAVKAIVIGVGGFLGIGEKNVAIDYSTIEWAEKDGDRWIVVPTTADQLKELAAFDPAPYEPEQPVAANDGGGGMGAGGGMAPSTDTTAQAPATPPAAAPAPAEDSAAAPADDAADDTAAAPADDAADDPAVAPAPSGTDSTAAAPADKADDTAAAEGTDSTETAAIDRSSLKELTTADISAESFVGTTVYGANEENIGEIGDVVLSQDGKVESVIIDVGGFLGVGEKPVAVGMDNLTFMADEDGDQYLYTTFTKEQLDAAPAYDESTYAEKRDEQRIIMEN